MRTEFRSAFCGALLAGLALGSGAVRADTSCANILAEKSAVGQGGWYAIEISVHREDTNSVAYGGDTIGFLVPQPDGSFAGHSDMLFSERMSEGQQPFDIRFADDVNLVLDPMGHLSIYRAYVSGVPAGDDSVDLVCKGKVLTAYVPDYGVVTLTFRDLYLPAH